MISKGCPSPKRAIKRRLRRGASLFSWLFLCGLRRFELRSKEFRQFHASHFKGFVERRDRFHHPGKEIRRCRRTALSAHRIPNRNLVDLQILNRVNLDPDEILDLIDQEQLYCSVGISAGCCHDFRKSFGLFFQDFLDTARLRSRLADYMNVSQKNVHAYVLGEHGDSSFVPWSTARICNVPLERYKDCVTDKSAIQADLNYAEIEEYMRTSGGKIIQRKGATFYAIAISVCHICECIYENANAVVALSTMMHGEYGIDDVCLSIPVVVNAHGCVNKVLPDITAEEVEKLRRSADTLKAVIAQVQI